jgi:CDP-glucose 4,6-dehydratase
VALWSRALESLEMNAAFWAGRRVLITGHTGFKGSWLSLWLSGLGAEVTGYALEPATNPSLFQIANVPKRVSSVIGDVRDLAALRACITRARPEVVIHMAAQALVRPSYADPVETYQTNVMGTVNLLEAIREVGEVRAVVVVTSDKCYENREWLWGYRESDPVGGRDPYSSSKACAELVTSAFRSSFFAKSNHQVGISSARAGNVIGGGDWAQDRLVPDVISAFANGRSVTVRNPTAIRPWQHVLEPLGGYLTLAEKLFHDPAGYSESWNFGPQDDDAKSVSWLVCRLAELWGSGSEWSASSEKEVHEAQYLKLDCSNLMRRLGGSLNGTALTMLVSTPACSRRSRSTGMKVCSTHECEGMPILRGSARARVLRSWNVSAIQLVPARRPAGRARDFLSAARVRVLPLLPGAAAAVPEPV